MARGGPGRHSRMVAVDGHGRGHRALRSALAQDAASVALVTVMWANNEVGTLQPVHEVAAARAHTAFRCTPTPSRRSVRCRSTSARAGWQRCRSPATRWAARWGALLVRPDVELVPVLHGGGQERDVRSGTVDVAGAAGFAESVVTATEARAAEARRLAGLRHDLVRAVQAAVPDAVLNGEPTAAGRLPGNAHFSFPGCEGDSLLLLLDGAGIECSTGSACSAGVSQPSHVLAAMGVPADLARGSLRFTLGHTSAATDVEALAAVIGPVVERAGPRVRPSGDGTADDASARRHVWRSRLGGRRSQVRRRRS